MSTSSSHACSRKKCATVGSLLSSPLILYLAITYVWNVPPIIMGAMGRQEHCSESILVWFDINMLLPLIHLVMSCYLIWRVRSSDADEEEAKEEEANEQQLLFADTGIPVDAIETGACVPLVGQEEAEKDGDLVETRIRDMLELDGVLVPLYLVMWLIWFLWLCYGLYLLYQQDSNDCFRGALLLAHSLRCGFLYIAMFAFGAAFILCWVV